VPPSINNRLWKGWPKKAEKYEIGQKNGRRAGRG